MAEILNKDPATYERERESFVRDLKHFCEARGTPTRRPPTINGKELDLYLLYQLVTSKGGWVKVNQRNEWTNIANQFDHLKHCVNGEVALKHVYLRYLDRYEKINFLGETCERTVDDDDDQGRHKRFSTRVVNPVPHLYNYHQHVVPDSVRASGKLSSNLYVASEYDKLALSLISPLPNEQDFAINVCALLSGSNNEGRSTTLKLCNHPRLLHYLLAHAAVYNHPSLRNLMEENYKEIRGYSLKYFWSDVLEDKELSILMDEKKLVKRRAKAIRSGGGGCIEYDDIVSSDGDDTQKFSGENDVDCRLKLEPDDKELFCVGRSYGTQDFVGQRVLQVAMILRNATFIDDNVPTLARDSTFLRFVLLCCGSRWNCLHQLGFDMLSNIAHEITLEDYLVDHILRIVCQGLESPDRAVILGCVETLNKLGQREENEEVMLRCIEQRVYDRICSFLTLQDIMLLIHTLECLYSLSSLGEKACNSIVHVHGAIDTLVSLVTVEAQSYGPKACILMRVVETITGDQQESDNTSFFSAPSISHSSSSTYSSLSSTSVVNTSTSGSYIFPSSTMTPSLTSNVPSMVVSSLPNSVAPVSSSSLSLQATAALPTQAVASPVAMPISLQHARPATPQRVVLVTSTSTTTTSSPIVPAAATAAATAVVAAAAASASIAVTVNSSAASTNAVVSTTVNHNTHPSIVATQQENENFATQWLKSTFETHSIPGRGIEQNEMYKLYLTACSRAGRRGVIAPHHFPPCVRSVFGANVGPRPVVPLNAASNAESTPTSKLLVYEGIQVRAKPLNVTVTPSTLTQPARTPSSPILKAQLSGPSAPTITKKEVKSKVTSSHPHLSNVLLNAGASTTAAAVSTPAKAATTTVASSSLVANDASNSTSLIKSLLASKVGDIMSPKTASVTLKNDKTHQLVLNTGVAAQMSANGSLSMSSSAGGSGSDGGHGNNNVTQRQQQQQLQQHKIIAQPHMQTISTSGDSAGNVQIVQMTQQPVTQPQLVQVIQASQQSDQKPQIIQLTPSVQQQLLQVNASSDKPQLVQISHPGGQQQLIQLTPSGQQQLLQICQQASQSPQPSIIQVCTVKPEPSMPASENVAAQQQQQQQVILSQSGGQAPQVIQITPALQQQLLPQLPQAVQQQLLQASQQAASQKVASQVVVQPQKVAAQVVQSQQVASLAGHQSQQVSSQVVQVAPQIIVQQQQLQQQQQQQQLQQQQQQSITSSTSTHQLLLTQQLIQEQGAQSVVIQQQQPQQVVAVSSDGSQQQLSLAPPAKQPLISEVSSAGAPTAVVKQVLVQASQSMGTQVSQGSQTPLGTSVEVKQEPVVQSPTVSVITSAANMKPTFSRINGMRAVNSASIVDEEKNNIESNSLTDEKMESSPELQSASNSNDSSDIPKPALVNQTPSKVIVENHAVPAVSVPCVNNKNVKTSDLDSELSESSSNQSLPVISIKDTENNLPSCEMPSEDSTGMFDDFLINGKGGNTMDGSLSNNMMSEDSLLNNIIMRDEELVESSDCVMVESIKTEVIANNGTLLDNEKSNSSDAIPAAVAPTKESNEQMTDVDAAAVGGVARIEADLKKEPVEVQMDTDEAPPKPCNNFSGILKPEVKSEDRGSAATNVLGKNLMLAELLEKNSEKKEAPPILNGAVRLSEKGFELISKEEMQRNMKPTFLEKTVICSNKKVFPAINNVDSIVKPELVVGETVLPAVTNQRIVGVKRTNDQEVQCDTDIKKPHLNGDALIKCEEEVHDEANVKASSSAANLYAALAADVLGDIDGMEDEEVPCVSSTTASAPTTSYSTVTPSPSTVIESPSQQLYLAAGSNPRQILVTASSSSMAPRVVMGTGGQQYFLTPQTAIVQGQPQTVLVTQTAQQHGTGAKTIIILQSQTQSGGGTQQQQQQQKMLMQKVAGGAQTPIMAVSSSPVVATQSLSNTLKGVAQTPPIKVLQATGPTTQPTQMASNQFATGSGGGGGQTITNVFTLNGNGGAQQQLSSGGAAVSAQLQQQVAQVANGLATANAVAAAQSPTAAQQLQQTAGSALGRQVKVIKTVSHLQSVVGAKAAAQLHLPHHGVASVVATTAVSTDTPVPAVMAAAGGSVVPNVNVANVMPQPQNVQTQPAAAATPAVATTTATVASTSGAAAAAAAAVAAAAASANASSSTATPTAAVSTAATIVAPVRTADLGQFLCEWRSCMRSFRTANEVYLHACAAHCPSGSQEIQCLWERCDAMKRKRFSLMTHLYDRHCNPEVLKMMAVRRRQISQSGRSEIPPPTPPTPHPGYAPNAALHAIKRHALEFVNPKELQDENEGPVTKSIRLTSSLILRNVVIYSTGGKRHLKSFEPHLAGIALSNVESSRTIAQILYDMNEHNR